MELEIALLGGRYRAQHLFMSPMRIVDFALLDDRVVIEVDGRSHDKPDQKWKDLTSSLALEARGWRVVRVTNEEALRDPAGVVASLPDRIKDRPTPQELQAALDSHPWRPPVRAKRRARVRVPHPKKAPKSAGAKARKSV